MDKERELFYEMMILTGENPFSKPLYSPQIPYGVAWDRARGSAVTDRLSRRMPALHGNDPLVRGFGHTTARERDCGSHRHRWNKSS